MRPSTAVTQVGSLQRLVYIGLAGLLLLLAILGIVLPGLPATPFILGASYLLVRSSPRLHRRLIRSRTFGPLLSDWHRYRGMRPRMKWIALGLIAVSVAASLALGQLPWVAHFAICGLAGVGMLVVWRLPDAPADAPIPKH